MSLDQQIKDLLYRHDCVIIPGFGGILAQRQSAKIHESTQNIAPPYKKISFNAQLKQDDGLLVNYIAKVSNLSYEEAKAKVNREVNDLINSLEKYDEVCFGSLGNFKLDQNKVLFEANPTINLLTEAFGLTTTQLPGSRKPAVINLPEESKQEKEKTLRPKESKFPFLRVASASIIFLGIAGFLGYQQLKQEVNNHNLAAQEAANQKVEQKIQEATFALSNPLPEIVYKVKQAPRGNYHIVAGAFREKENASKKTQQLRTLGFPAREIGKNQYGLHQVIYASYQNRSEALKALKTIQTTKEEGAWLLVKAL